MRALLRQVSPRFSERFFSSDYHSFALFFRVEWLEILDPLWKWSHRKQCVRRSLFSLPVTNCGTGTAPTDEEPLCHAQWVLFSLKLLMLLEAKRHPLDNFLLHYTGLACWLEKCRLWLHMSVLRYVHLKVCF